jgi:hypothetical protein
MKTTWIAGLCLGLAMTCRGEQVLTEFDWQKLSDAHQSQGGEALVQDGKSALKVVNTNDTPLLVRLLTIQKPPIKGLFYALTGEVKYEDVHGDAYLQMWNVFPPPVRGMTEAQYFSRTLGDGGEMGKISGTSNWRAFMLPFDRTGTSNAPSRLQFDIYLPAQGTVYLGPIKLVEYSGTPFGRGKSSPGAWWQDQTAGLVGGIGGATLGCLAGLLAWLASRGQARSFVVVTMWVLTGLGAVLAGASVVALAMSQPYAVWFPLVLGALLLLGIIPARLRQFQKHYEELELRRMTALDALEG